MTEKKKIARLWIVLHTRNAWSLLLQGLADVA